MSVSDDVVEIVRRFASEVIAGYGAFIKSIVLVGSAARGEASLESDIDLLVILDDTLKEYSSVEKGLIEGGIREIASNISGRLEVQPVLTLTEFMDYVRVGHPTVYNFLKEGVPIYDEGFFMPWKRLLLAGKIPGTREAFERYIDEASERISRAKSVKLLILAEDCYYAFINSAQATLMYMGLEPPVPRRIYEAVRKHLVDTGLLEEEYAEWLREIGEIRRDIKNSKILEVPGVMIDEWISRAEKFTGRMISLMHTLELLRRQETLQETYEVMREAVAEALKKRLGIPAGTSISELERRLGMSLREALQEYLVKPGEVSSTYLTIWDEVEELKEEVIDRKNPSKLGEEVYGLKQEVRKLIQELNNIGQ